MMLPEEMLRAAASLLPVLVFLAALLFLDTYKLVRLRAVLQSLLAGCAAAAVCWLLNAALMAALAVEPVHYYRYGAPLVEEAAKGLYLVFLIRTHRVGFMVDAAVHGFAVGAGFALVENLYYLHTLLDAAMLTWVIRGFGTAVMHGSAAATFAILSKSLTDRAAAAGLRHLLPGFVLAFALHALYNHFLLPPLLFTLLLILVFPLVVLVVFHRSEQQTRDWLNVGFDSDQELLRVFTSGHLPESRVGRFLQALRDTFPGEVVADMFCLLQLHVELSIHAKGMLMMREAGFDVAPDPAVREKFEELQYLRRSIGPTGLLALAPFLDWRSRDLWELYLLSSTQPRRPRRSVE